MNASRVIRCAQIDRCITTPVMTTRNDYPPMTVSELAGIKGE
jgi:hypothetical protein